MVVTLRNSDLIQVGGILTSEISSGQQWDSPNAWSPIQSLLIDALRNMDIPSSTALAQTLALQWIQSNFIGFKYSGFMSEKYNAFIPGMPGNGGEYESQVGFGWTNGVVLDLLNVYGHVARST